MRKLVIILLLLLNTNLLANPIVIVVPVISEYYYNQGNWQIEFCIRTDLYGWLEIQSFDQLTVKSNATQASFLPYFQFYYDTVYVIDQSWLSSTLIIDTLEDNLNIYIDEWEFWDGISYSPYPDTLVVSTPGANESVAVQYFSYGWSAYAMKQSPPTIGSDLFEVSSRSGISGYVFDQYQNPIPGLSLNFYASLNSWYPQPLITILTDPNGHYESDEMYPMGYYVELEMNNCVLETDMMYFEPDSNYYRDYEVWYTGINDNKFSDDIKISSQPNPFTNHTTFDLSIPDIFEWNNLSLAIINMNGRQVDFIPIDLAPWSNTEISLDWSPGNLQNGLYVYSLLIDGQPVKSGKLIKY